MWLTRLAISRPILIWMILTAIAVMGLLAYARLPAELNPRVDIPTLTVTTVYPGAGPPEVEAQISKPLEDAVGTVGGVKDVFSSSQPGLSILSMDFQVGTDLNAAAAEVQSRVELVRAQMPPEARSPVIAKLDINAQPILYLGILSESLAPQQLRALADNTLRPRLQRVPGVGSVQVIGGEQREIEVAADPLRLARYGLTIEDVVNALKAGGRDVPGGSVTRGPLETDVRLAGAYSSLTAIRSTQILPQSASLPPAATSSPTSHGFSNGSADALPAPPLTVEDVAEVTDAVAPRTALTRIDGQEGVSLVLTKASDAGAVMVVDGVNRALAGMKSTLPADLHWTTLRDEARTVRDALDDVDFSLVLGAVLAMSVILLFLHNLRGTLIVSIAIPACVLATFLVMGLANFTLNQMTLLALSLSVGILVDDSIVVLESITRHLQLGETPPEAAYNGRSEIGFADITTTLVDVVVFVPIAFMGGIVGGFFKQFGLAIVTATLFSLVISFTVTPMLAARWYRQGENLEAAHGIFAPLERLYRALEAGYRVAIRWALGHRWGVVGAGALALALVLAVTLPKLGFEFLPGTDQGQIAIAVTLPPGASLEATDAAARQVETALRGQPDVAGVVTNVGQVLGGFGSIPQEGPQYAQINVRLNDKAGWLDAWRHSGRKRARTRSDQQIEQDLREPMRRLSQTLGSRITVSAVRSVTGISLPVEIQLRGSDTNQLALFADRVRERIATLPGVLDPDVSVRSGMPEVRVQVDSLRAAPFHISAGLAGAVLRDAVTGNTDMVYHEAGREYPIRAHLAGLRGGDPRRIGEIAVSGDIQGQPVALADIGTLTLQGGPANIERDNGQHLVTVTANLTPGTPLGNLQQTVQRTLDTLPHPGIEVHWGGDAETLDENVIPFATALGLAIVLVYLVMASLFNDLGTPFVIMFALPMALVGALGALVLTGETLSLIAAIGVIMLVGLMGRNAILLLDYTNTLRARGLSRNEALIEAGATRLRPILMTTTATIIGMLPVALRFGRASEIRAPMAIVVIGGLLVSTVLTLIVIPALYSLYDSRFGKSSHGSLQ